MENGIWQVRIPEYIDQVLMSQKRRAKYFNEGDELPKKYQKPRYAFENGVLHDVEHLGDDSRVIKNSKTAGTPRFQKVNFQGIYNGSIATFARAKLITGIHDYYSKVFKKAIDEGTFPATINLEEDERLVIYFQFSNVYAGSDSSDIDNHCHLHIKASLDVLTRRDNPNQKNEHKLGIIPDDTRRYIKGIYYDITDIPNTEVRDLTVYLIKAHKDFKLSDTSLITDYER